MLPSPLFASAHPLLRRTSPLIGAVLLMACAPQAPIAPQPADSQQESPEVDLSDWSLGRYRSAPGPALMTGYADGPSSAVIVAIEDHDAKYYGGNEVTVTAVCIDALGNPTDPSGEQTDSDQQPALPAGCVDGYPVPDPPYYFCNIYDYTSALAEVRLEIDCPPDAVAVSATSDNGSESGSLTVPLPGDAPPAITDKYATPDPVELGGTAVLSLFADDDVDIASYTVDCDSDDTLEHDVDVPGTEDISIVVSENCVYTALGDTDATFTVTDSNGQTTIGQLAIDVQDTTPPTVDLGGPYLANPGDVFVVDLSAADLGGLGTYTLACDQTAGVDASGVYPTDTDSLQDTEDCSLPDSGEFTAALVVVDSSGNTATATAAVRINFPPTAVGSAMPAAEGEPLSIDASASADSDGSIVLYEVDCDGDEDFDVSSETDAPLTCPAQNDDGTFTADLRVTDDGGLSTTVPVTLTVLNADPVADAGPDQAATYTTAFTFAGSFTDVGSADTQSFAWDFGDGNTASGSPTPTHLYASPGIYTVTLTVTDDDGGSSQSTLQITAVDTASTCEVLLSEVMANPLDGEARQWIEVHNPTANPIDLVGMVVSSLAGETSISSSVVVPAGGFATLCRDLDQAGFTCDHELTDFSILASGPDELTLSAADAVLTTVSLAAAPAGESLSSACNAECDTTDGRTTGFADNPADPTYGTGGSGTPGLPSEDDFDEDGASVCDIDPDCDDADPMSYPGNPEVCDGTDNDCSGTADDGPDADGDGVADVCDTCVGNDQQDADSDGIPDDCDGCPLDGAPGDDDDDDDGVCDSDDLCDGSDDAVDQDEDGVPDGCDPCPLDVDDDSDSDGVCDSDDLCDGEDDTLDTDGDNVVDCLDACPDDPLDLCEDTGDLEVDLDADGFTVEDGDCNDINPFIYPGAPDRPDDGIDSDCDGEDPSNLADEPSEAPSCQCNSQAGGLHGALLMGLAALFARRRRRS